MTAHRSKSSLELITYQKYNLDQVSDQTAWARGSSTELSTAQPRLMAHIVNLLACFTCITNGGRRDLMTTDTEILNIQLDLASPSMPAEGWAAQTAVFLEA